MQEVSNGDTVQVHYTGKLDDGKVFDSSADRDPLEFKVGDHQVIKGFEEGVIGMKAGDKKEITIPPDKGYGNRTDDNIHEISSQNISSPKDSEFKVGMPISLKNEKGEEFYGIVQEVKDKAIVIDFNHFLAGKNLTFDVELMAIK